MDTVKLDEIKNRAEQLRSLFSARDAMYEELQQMLHMEWYDQPKADWIKATLSPSAHNALMGAVRLMTATDPQFNVPHEESNTKAKSSSDKIEKACRAMWAGSGRVTQRPPHYEMVYSGLLFAEIDADVTRTQDLLNYAEKTKDNGLIARMKAASVHSPYIFTAHNPMTCYPDLDALGLRGRLRRVSVRWGDVLATWGQLAQEAMPSYQTKQLHEPVTLNDWYDWEHRAVWLDDTSQAILCEPHELGFLPVISRVVEGSMLWSDPEKQRIPFLYALLKSGLWRRENLSLTVIYSLMFALGSNPLLQREVDDPQNAEDLVVDRTIPGGVVTTRKGEGLKAMMEKIIDPSQWQGLETAQRLNEESTISKMALGSAPTGNMPFSAISLLSQSGRLPLVSTRQIGGQSVADLLTIALQWYRATGEAKFYTETNAAIDLKKDEIPERIPLTVSLEPDVPTDKLQMANIANAITQGQDPLVSKRWARENILQLGQSRTMQKEIWTEQRMALEQQRLFQQLAAQDQAKLQAMMTPQPPAVPGGGQAKQVDPNESAYLNGPVGPGAPLSGPVAAGEQTA